MSRSRSTKRRPPKRARNNAGSISLRQDGRYQVTITVGKKPDGTPDRIYRYANTPEEAEKVKAELVYRHSRGQLRRSDPAPFGLVAERWLAVRKGTVQDATHHGYAQILRSHVLPTLGDVEIAKITAVAIEDLLINLSERGLGSRSRILALWLTRSVLDYAVKRELLTSNPAASVSSPKGQQKPEIVAWTPDETARFLEAAHKDRLYAAFYLLLASGLRRGELLGLKWTAVDLVKGVISVKTALRKRVGGGVEFAKPKTPASRREVCVGMDVIEVLGAHRQRQRLERQHAAELWQENGLVFATTIGTPIHPDNLRRNLKRICEQVDLPVIRIHGLRHTHASLALRSNVDDKVLSQRLGHTDVSFTRSVYQHPYEDQHRRAALSLRALTGGLSEGQLLSN